MVLKFPKKAFVKAARAGIDLKLIYIHDFIFISIKIIFIFSWRYNARGFDLNRNFPDYFKQNNKKTQPETEAVREWVSKIQFVLSGSLHGGALVASYPFDNTPNARELFKKYWPYFFHGICKKKAAMSFIFLKLMLLTISFLFSYFSTWLNRSINR